MTTPSKSRNPWPLGVLAAFVLFISGTVALVVMACSQRSDLVSTDYYEQELKFQHRIENTLHAKNLGDLASVRFNAGQQSIQLQLPAEHARQQASGRILLYRPSAAGLDRELRLGLNPEGAQSVDTANLLPGLWKVRVQWNVLGQEYFLDQSVVVRAKKS